VDYYAVLGVKPNASTDEIERAFRALARKVHPDRNGEDAERATARMKQLNEIRETLTDPLLRAGYDDRLRQERQVRAAPPMDERARAARTPRPAQTPRPSTPRPAPEPPRASRFGESYKPHPHVAPFLRTNIDYAANVRPPRRDLSPLFILLVVAAAGGAVALLWPRPQPPPAPAIVAPISKTRPPRREAVVVVRGDARDLRRAVRKTARVVPIGASFDEVISKFGPPDRSEPGATTGDLALIYGQVRVELHDGLVVGGAP
jgi:hypothetical protein